MRTELARAANANVDVDLSVDLLTLTWTCLWKGKRQLAASARRWNHASAPSQSGTVRATALGYLDDDQFCEERVLLQWFKWSWLYQ